MAWNGISEVYLRQVNMLLLHALRAKMLRATSEYAGLVQSVVRDENNNNNETES